MITATNLTRRFDAITAVDAISFDIAAGSITGFLGPNGAGKTTTVRMLTGMLAPTSGSATVAGCDIVEQTLEMKARIGYVPESGALYEVLTPAEYLDFIGNLHHIDAATIDRRSHELAGLLSLETTMNQRLATLSKGTRQKVVIAAALLHRPDVLFLDEPLNGLDANAAMIVKELLRQMAQQGRTVFFCSHILEVVERICDEVIIIDHGRIVARGSVDALVRQCGVSTFEQAFRALTGGGDAGTMAREYLEALDRA